MHSLLLLNTPVYNIDTEIEQFLIILFSIDPF